MIAERLEPREDGPVNELMKLIACGVAGLLLAALIGLAVASLPEPAHKPPVLPRWTLPGLT